MFRRLILTSFALTVILFSLNACQTTSLHGAANTGYQKYMRLHNHKAFAVIQTSDGGYAWSYTSQRSSRREAYNEAKATCEETGKKYAFGECSVYDVDGIRLASLKRSEIEKILDETSVAAQASAKDLVMNIRGVWENVSTNVTGTFLSTSRAGRGPLKIEIENVTCTGSWQYVRGAYDTSTLPEGTWSAVCDNNVGASGTYRSFKVGEGQAKGTDSSGNKLDLFFTLTSQG